MKKTIGILMLAASSLTMASELPSGDEVARNVNARDEGVAVSRNLYMELVDRRGNVRERYTKAYRKYIGEDKRTAIFYLEPKNVKDTAFLTYDYASPSEEDDQWLYLPAMRKVRRISASDRGDYFLGTDFTFEEIKLETRYSTPDYTRKTIGVDEVDGVRCIVVESIPVSEEIAKELGHGRRVDCIDDDIWMARRTLLWDIKGKLLKTILYTDIRQVQNIWTAHTLTAENHKTGHSTKFVFSNVDYESGVQDELLTKNGLRRGL